MINISSRSEDWIRGIQGEYKTDPMLLEKAILALSLLEQLKISGLEFIFKGGTALILLLDKLNRLSIDIDIIIETQKKEQNEKIFDSVIQLETFLRVEKNDRESDKNIPKAHYKFYYQSVISKKEEYVLLDILYEKNLYCTLQDIKILSKLLVCDDVITMVKVPSINCILGDKLTAFAPNTTGIPYNQDKEMEIIKQLFDVACLFDKSDNIHVFGKNKTYHFGS